MAFLGGQMLTSERAHRGIAAHGDRDPERRGLPRGAAEQRRQLLERIRGLRLTSDTLVRDFVTEWDEMIDRFNAAVRG